MTYNIYKSIRLPSKILNEAGMPKWLSVYFALTKYGGLPLYGKKYFEQIKFINRFLFE